MCPIRDIDDEDYMDSEEQGYKSGMESTSASTADNCYIAIIGFEAIEYGDRYLKDEIEYLCDNLYIVEATFNTTTNEQQIIITKFNYKISFESFEKKLKRLIKGLSNSLNRILSEEDDSSAILIRIINKDKEVYFEQYVKKSQILDENQFESAVLNIYADNPCEWIVTSSTDIYIPENVVFYLNRVSEDAFKSIGLSFSKDNKLTYQIYEVRSSEESPIIPIIPAPRLYWNIQGNDRNYIEHHFTERLSWYDQPSVFMDIKSIRDNIKHFGYRLDLAFLMPYLYECAKYMMDYGFLIRDGVLYTDKVSHPQAYSTMYSDEIAEVTMEESIATAFMLNCIKTVAPDDYPVAEKIVQETWSPACRFGLKQLEVGAKWQDWREAKTHKDSLQLNEWFEKYFSNGNINDSIAYEPKDYKRALGLS